MSHTELYGVQCLGFTEEVYKYTMMYQSNTTKLDCVYYCIRATCFDSYRIIFSSFQDTDPHLAMFKTRCWIPKAYIITCTS